MAIDTGGGWLDKIKQNWPQMINALGTQMGGPMAPMASATGQMMQGRNKKNKQPGTQPSAGTPGNPFNNVQFGQTQMQPPPGQGGMQPPPAMGSSPLWQNYMMQQQQMPQMRNQFMT